jgi:hypothetical protein
VDDLFDGLDMQAGGPQLYGRYRREEIIAFFRGDGAGESLDEGQWMILPHALICMAVVGEPPTRSHFKSAARFCWVAENPPGAEPNFTVDTFRGKSRQKSQDIIWLFVRLTEWDDFLYVGRLAPPSHWRRGAHGVEVNFDLSPTLPTTTWNAMRRPPPVGPSRAKLDAMLGELGGATTMQSRFATLQALVEYWHGNIDGEDGLPEAALEGVRMPEVLKRWYRWAGRRDEILSGQNFLLQPHTLRVEDERLFFYRENQGCYL